MIEKLVRVVILNYNQAAFTIQCLDSVKKQSYKNLEVVVVDNGSNPEDLTYLEKRIEENIYLIKINKNLGFSGGNNVGIKYETTENRPDIFFILNNDTILNHIETISSLVDSLNEDEKAGAASPLIDTISSNIPAEVQIQVRRNVTFWSSFICNGAILRRIPYLKSNFNHFIYKDFMPFKPQKYLTDTINGAAFLIKESVVREINYLDEGVFLYFEELILGEQLKRIGFHCILDARVKLIHYQGASSKSRKGDFNWKMWKHHTQSEIYFYKNYLYSSNFKLIIVYSLRLFEYFVKQIIKSIKYR